jgi:hypothetical protein
VSRRERQQQQIVAALAQRHYARVLVLAREHLAEYPGDPEVLAAEAEARAAWKHHRKPEPDAQNG